MPITSEGVAQLAKQQLVWMDRTLTFKNALRTIPHIQAITPAEQLIQLLIGRMAIPSPKPESRVSLMALTTEAIYSLGPFHQVDPIVLWKGSKILGLSGHAGGVLRMTLRPEVERRELGEYIEFTNVNPKMATIFINFANVLCLQELWGNPEGLARFCERIVGPEARQLMLHWK
jgi:hypothetical protein